MPTTKKNSNSDQQILINNIIIRPIQRTNQDVQRWRNAMIAAESTIPIRVLLYDLYSDLILDAFLSSVMEKRILSVVKTELRYYNAAGEEITEMTDLIGMDQFHRLRKELILQKFWGITVCELGMENNEFKFYNVPRKHIRTDLGMIVWEQYGTEGVNYRESPFTNYIIEVGAQRDLGLLLKAAPYVLYKRGGFGDWSKFSELFGMPFREAKYDGFNDAVRVQLEKAMEQYGSSPWAVLPKEADFTLHEASNVQGGGQLYNDLRKACNEEISILILGQTETTTSSRSSGYAQAEIHAKTEDSINASDRKDELAIMNEKVAPVLRNLGYPIVDGGYFDHVMEDDDMPVTDQATVLVQLKQQLGLPIDDDYLYENFGIPKPDNYDELKAESQTQKAQNQSIHTQDAPPQQDESVISKPTPDTPNPKPETSKSKRKLSLMDKIRVAVDDFFG